MSSKTLPTKRSPNGSGPPSTADEDEEPPAPIQFLTDQYEEEAETVRGSPLSGLVSQHAHQVEKTLGRQVPATTQFWAIYRLEQWGVSPEDFWALHKEFVFSPPEDLHYRDRVWPSDYREVYRAWDANGGSGQENDEGW